MNTYTKGVLTGCDINHEWMLKWWWTNYRKANAYPVTFIDFGMSKAAKSWCEKHGTIISLRKPFIGTPPSSTSVYALRKRKIWLSKPKALLHTPYQKTIWIDLDAQVKLPLTRLFTLCPKDTLALCPELSFREQAEKESNLLPIEASSFNTGVIVYPKAASALFLWAESAKQSTSLGDQDLLSYLIFKKKIPIKLFSSIFNRIHPEPDGDDVVIYHYASQMGQSALLEKLNIGIK